MRARQVASLALALALAGCERSADDGLVEADPGPVATPDLSATGGSNRDLVEAIERLRGETAAIRKLLERATSGGGSLANVASPLPPSSPSSEADWAELERAAEARLVIESVSRYRARLIPDLLAAEQDAAAGPRPVQVHAIENGVPVLREETLDSDSLAETVDWHKKVLAGLARVRSLEDLARWRNEFQIEPLE